MENGPPNLRRSTWPAVGLWMAETIEKVAGLLHGETQAATRLRRIIITLQEQ